jgi:hypothetical protein
VELISMNQPISVEQLQRTLGGKILRGKNGLQLVCPGPGHSHNDASLAVSPANNEDALWSIGVPATCNPQGAGKWRDESIEIAPHL